MFHPISRATHFPVRLPVMTSALESGVRLAVQMYCNESDYI